MLASLMPVTLIRGGTVITMNPGRDVLADAAIAVVDDLIVAVGSFAELDSLYPTADVIGSAD